MKRVEQKGALREWLKMVTFIVLVLSFLPLAIKGHNWWEDGRGPNRLTAAWKSGRLYTTDIESALAILETTDMAEVNYLRSRGNPIQFVPGSEGRMGDTMPDGMIELPNRLQGYPAEIAVVLSHEILHAERHDPFVLAPKPPLLHRLLWRGEEADAHTKSLLTAIDLWRKDHSVWRVSERNGCLSLFFIRLQSPLFSWPSQ